VQVLVFFRERCRDGAAIIGGDRCVSVARVELSGWQLFVVRGGVAGVSNGRWRQRVEGGACWWCECWGGSGVLPAAGLAPKQSIGEAAAVLGDVTVAETLGAIAASFAGLVAVADHTRETTRIWPGHRAEPLVLTLPSPAAGVPLVLPGVPAF
jgi:hypothetical protein